MANIVSFTNSIPHCFFIKISRAKFIIFIIFVYLNLFEILMM